MSKFALISGTILFLIRAVYGATLYVPSQYPTIQSGINAAVDGDTVLVADGNYTGTGNKNIDFLGKAIVVMSENGPETCVVDCQNDGRGFYFHSGEGPNSILSGFKIMRGYFSYGGGICCENSSPRISQCIITENSVSAPSSSGGGVYLLDSDAGIFDCTISWNAVNAQWNNHGGGIISWGSNPEIVNCTIEHNAAADGAGILLWGDTAQIVGCMIRCNSGVVGGGIYCLGSPHISDCIIDSNVAVYEGGGILIGEGAAPEIENCAFIANAAHQGGGIWNFKSEATIRNCEITANAADEGGGVYSYQWYANLYLQNCLIAENSATGNGGGVYVFDAISTILNCTISRNLAGGNGGGIFYYIFISPTIVNTIVEGNQGNGGVFFLDSPNADIRFSDFSNNEGGNFAGAVPPQLGHLNAINANGDSCDAFYNIFEDPLFEDPAGGNFQITWANYPIPDSTRSPCIDAGDPNSPPDPDGTIADIGAFYFPQEGGTVIPGGPVLGIWELSGSPYLIQGEITILNGDTLIIEPGVVVNFQGHYKFIINGILEAVGTQADSILFTAANPAEGWHGIRLFDAPDSSHLSYCIIQHGQASGSSWDHYGGGVFCFNSNPAIRHCTFSDNAADWAGGAIYCYTSAHPLLENCAIIRNSAPEGGGIFCGAGVTIRQSTIALNSSLFGGGIHCYISNHTIENCIINQNTAVHGGGLYIWWAYPLVDSCVISENTATEFGGGLAIMMDSEATIRYCTINGNSAGSEGGAGIYTDKSALFVDHCTISRNSTNQWGGGIFLDAQGYVKNTVIEGNTGIGGISFVYAGLPISVNYSDLHNNAGGNFSGNVPPGLGIVSGVNANGDSCDVFYNIFEDPLFADPGAGNFQITWANYPSPDSTMSPCIDAGDPNSPHDPDGTIADMGALYFDQSGSLQISLSPVNPPIFIPPNGGSFSFNAIVSNASSASQTFDVWCNVQVPGGSQFNVLGPVSLTLNAGASLTRLRTQGVPASAPGGEYAYWGFVGDYPWNVTSSDHFPFVKQGGDNAWAGPEGWHCFGEPFPDEIATVDQPPEEFSLHGAFPNPFNPVTMLRFDLPKAGLVKMVFYDISGRLVATLVDGWREAGTHEVTFDGAGLPSGIYLAKLTAGGYSALQKLVLMK